MTQNNCNDFMLATKVLNFQLNDCKEKNRQFFIFTIEKERKYRKEDKKKI